MKLKTNDGFRVKPFHTYCSLNLSAYKHGNGIQLNGDGIEGNRHLFAYHAFLFLLDYMHDEGVKTSKSFESWIMNAALDSLYKMVEKYIVEPKTRVRHRDLTD